MSTHRRGGYLGGSSLVQVSVRPLRDRTKEHDAKALREKEKFAAVQKSFEQNQTSKLIRSDSPEVQKLLLKHKATQERAKRRAERKALRKLLAKKEH